MGQRHKVEIDTIAFACVCLPYNTYTKIIVQITVPIVQLSSCDTTVILK